jgi:hypothetical protein
MLIHTNVNSCGSFSFHAGEIEALYQHQVEQLSRLQSNSIRSLAEIEHFITLVQQKRQILPTLPEEQEWDWQILSTREPAFLLSNLLGHGFGQCWCSGCQGSYVVVELAVYDWQGTDPTWREYQCPADHVVHQQILRFGELFDNAQPIRIKAEPFCRCAELWYG